MMVVVVVGASVSRAVLDLVYLVRAIVRLLVAWLPPARARSNYEVLEK